jgi:hypothetical protein
LTKSGLAERMSAICGLP